MYLWYQLSSFGEIYLRYLRCMFCGLGERSGSLYLYVISFSSSDDY